MPENCFARDVSNSSSSHSSFRCVQHLLLQLLLAYPPCHIHVAAWQPQFAALCDAYQFLASGACCTVLKTMSTQLAAQVAVYCLSRFQGYVAAVLNLCDSGRTSQCSEGASQEPCCSQSWSSSCQARKGQQEGRLCEFLLQHQVAARSRCSKAVLACVV